MDLLNSVTGGGNKSDKTSDISSDRKDGNSGGGFLGGIGDKLNSAAGGGRESEKNEDMLDKGELMQPG